MKWLPSWKNALLALLAAGMLVLAFPDFEWWWMAWFALVPLMWAVERQKHCVHACFLLGWLFGTAYFFGTCWWLTYAPIHYASIPWPVAYLLILIACLGAGVFPAIFATILAVRIRRAGNVAAYCDAFWIWIAVEFVRYFLTGNNWNAIGYSSAAGGGILWLASIGGVYLVGAPILFLNGFVASIPSFVGWAGFSTKYRIIVITYGTMCCLALLLLYASTSEQGYYPPGVTSGRVVAIQPNVPMSGLDYQKWEYLRQRQFDLAEVEIRKIKEQLSAISSELPAAPITVILPESPMNFRYNDDREFQQFVREFTTRNNVSLVFNSAEPDAATGRYFNSAMMIGTDGKPVAQYDKIYLLPFGEAVPVPFESILPAFVGNFAYGSEYDLLPVGDAKAGVMICFESHFGQLGREYVRDGADVLIEMTNDGYLGPTPVLRQHLANAVFRAVETNRPVLRVTNVGITAYIDERGLVHDPLPAYSEATRVWNVSKSDGSQTFYVKYGDWFAWLCTVVTCVFLMFPTRQRCRGSKEN